MPNTRTHLLVTAASLPALAAVLLLAAPALAQTPPAAAAAPADPEDIVVTGFRASLLASLKTKQIADQVVESISQEDIGKLPDNSIAEALGRLPGLTTQRQDGRSTVISIRGLGPDFSTTLLNGREQVSIGNNRGVEFDQYPSEVLNGVDVFKTPKAELVAAGLAGTVNMKTIRPLSYGKSVVALNLRGEVNDNGKLNVNSTNKGWRGSATYVDQFADNTVGLSIGLAYQQSPTQTEYFNSWGYPDGGPGGARVIGGSKSYVASDNLKRFGVVGTLEFEPSDSYNTVLDVYYSHFDVKQNLRGVEIPLFWGGHPLAPNPTVTNGFVTAGTFNNVTAVERNDFNSREADLFAVGWSNKWTLDKWNFTTDVSYSHIKRNDIVLETYSGTGRNFTGQSGSIGFVQNERGAVFNSSINYGDRNLIKLTSPRGWGDNVVPGGQDGYFNKPNTRDDLAAFKATAGYELDGAFKSIEAGVNYTLRRKTFAPQEFFLGLKANAADPLKQTSVALPDSYFLGITQLKFLGNINVVSYDPYKLVTESGLYNQIANPNGDVAIKGWRVAEDVLTGYVQGNIDTDLGETRLTGNVGAQVVYTNQSSQGQVVSTGGAGGVRTTIDRGAKYTYVLPSLNLSFRMPGNNVVRLGLSRSMARARTDQMAAPISFGYNPSLAGSTNINQSPWSGEGGNPTLRPWIADSIDLSYENYFGKEGIFALQGFYKKLRTYIYRENLPYDFTGFPVPSGPNPVLRQGFVSIWSNGDGGNLYGVEATLTVPFGLFSDALDGFGFSANGSITETSITPNGPGTTQPIPGYSKWVTHSTLYYEKAGFSIRGTLNTRSSFLAEVRGFGAGRELRFAAGESTVDAQIGYEFQEGRLQGASVVLQGYNLTNERFKTFNFGGDERQVIDYYKFGRRFLVGIGYKF
ncbi:TonB-dependent receptor [Sandaracinobacteroides saxicola]|uniref:TonB-dependent receptor n=1 Tax=Sandaracinobacteroides saxicola TaxID=2759707 RepID=A0A7G5IFL9_9SPHN|nr:TonB-dependent receptor [Sandaracinobacteroides saxicola]QMW22161.1 TonB-dependent receptor [Sandaracinobacteroides saxicola]